jgi:chromosome segregation ATPase
MSRQLSSGSIQYNAIYDVSCDITLSEVDYLVHDNADLNQSIDSLQNEIHNLNTSNNELSDTLSSRTAALHDQNAMLDLLRQENRVLKSLLQMGWSEEERVKAIQAQRNGVVDCLKELNAIQSEIEDGLKKSRDQTAKLTNLASCLGRITTTPHTA